MKLSSEQKEQLKMAHRASERIAETWSLYTMFLAHDKRPREALELAQEAVAVWADFQDSNEVEPPEIERPNLPEQLDSAFSKMFQAIDARKSGGGILSIDPEQGTAAFESITAAEVDSHARQNSEPASETGTLNKKEPTA